MFTLKFMRSLKTQIFFNIKHYSGMTNDFSNKLADDKGSIVKDLDNSILKIVNYDPRALANISLENLKELRDLTFQRLQIEAGSDIFSVRDTENVGSDLSVFKRWFASYEDVDNPYLNTYKKILDRALHKVKRENNRKLRKRGFS